MKVNVKKTIDDFFAIKKALEQKTKDEVIFSNGGDCLVLHDQGWGTVTPLTSDDISKLLVEKGKS